jgi:carboxyl-terminal processing protease
MRSRNLITPLFPIALFSFLVFCSSKRQGGESELLEGVIEQLNIHHYQPVKLNDELSANIFDNFLDKLDNERRFFTQQDMRKLEKYRTQLDDQIKRGSYEFMDTAWSLFSRRMNQAETLYTTLLQKPFSFSNTETWNYDNEHPKYAKDDKEFQENWRKALKYNILERSYRKSEQQKEALLRKDTTVKGLPADSIESRARAEVLKTNNDWFKRLRRMNRKDKISFYINSITEIYDPHTNFFPPADKQNFDIGMSGKLEGIGATLVERDGYIKVERIVPGSASYRQGELKASDLILKVGQAAGDPVDVVGMDIDDAIQLIRGKKGTEVRLTVKKPDGSIKIIPIVRDVVIIEEGFAKSAVTEFGGRTFGVINLPSFYADFNERGGRSSAEDVRRELFKLRDAGVKGIVLDLRNNGGGSLRDAVEMAGLFFKAGPVVQVRNRQGDVEVLSDYDEQVVWDGPLVILTNAFSASASEILAAAMQDYRRAIIVGSKSTFGKGTVQTFFNLGAGNVFDTRQNAGMGSVKVTIQKFYRINGGTTQLVGVTPDVVIPDAYDFMEMGEKEQKYAMQFDKIKPAGYEAFNYSNRSDLIAGAQTRVSASPHYKLVQEYAAVLDQRRKVTEYPLSLSAYAEEESKRIIENKRYSDTSYKSSLSDIKPLQSDMDAVQQDEAKSAQRRDWMKPYKRDAMMEQAVLLLNDWK